jgi:hypothetical protein
MNCKELKKKLQRERERQRSGNSSVDVAMGYGWKAGVLFPARLREFLHSFQADSGAHPVSGFPGGKGARP